MIIRSPYKSQAPAPHPAIMIINKMNRIPLFHHCELIKVMRMAMQIPPEYLRVLLQYLSILNTMPRFIRLKQILLPIHQAPPLTGSNPIPILYITPLKKSTTPVTTFSTIVTPASRRGHSQGFFLRRMKFLPHQT